MENRAEAEETVQLGQRATLKTGVQISRTHTKAGWLWSPTGNPRHRRHRQGLPRAELATLLSWHSEKDSALRCKVGGDEERC